MQVRQSHHLSSVGANHSGRSSVDVNEDTCTLEVEVSERTKEATTVVTVPVIPSCQISYPDLAQSSFAIQTHESRIRAARDMIRLEVEMLNFPDPCGTTQRSNEEIFRSPLGFHIPDHRLQAALDAEAETPASYWQYRLYQGPRGRNHDVIVHYCKTKEAMESVSKYFLDEKVIGFDIEWMAQAKVSDGIKQNVSLIQVASEERIALFHISRFFNAAHPDDFVAPTFRRIMESPNILKTGVAIKGDCTRLRNHLAIECQGLFELSHLYKVNKYYNSDRRLINKTAVKLADQVKEHLLLPLLKGAVQTSTWTKDLTREQVQYAASDSYASLMLYYCMEAKRKAQSPTPPCPAPAELNRALLPVDSPPEILVADSESDDLDDSSSEFPCSEDELQSLAEGLEQLDVAKAPITDRPAKAEVHGERRPSLKAKEPSKPAFIAMSAQLLLAEAWAQDYKSLSAGSVSIPIPALRAYHLWHVQKYDAQEVCNLLRSPPLRPLTVIEYICEAVSQAKLAADPLRLAALGQTNLQPHKYSHKKLLILAVKEARKRKELVIGPTRDGDDSWLSGHTFA